MRVAVVDIGSNTARLLVAESSAEGPVRIRGEKAYLGLGAEILHTGAIGDAKLLEASRVARRYVRLARKLGAARLDVLVTAPGRQAANADELLHAIARATRTSVRGISAEEEAELEPPAAEAARAVGGSARALARVVGRTLGVEELEQALELVGARRSAKVAQTFGLDHERARVLPAGALVLSGVAGLLGMPLRLARGGLREGAAASLLSREAAA